MEQFARIGKAVANPHRLELLDLLCQGSRSVDELAGVIEQSVANTSQHLQVLKSARLVESRRQGHRVHYSLADDAVGEFWGGLQRLAVLRLAEAQQILHDYFHARDALEPITSPELMRRMQADDVIVLDVRPATEYRQGHIPGALSVPLAELEARVGDLPTGAEIVAYCRGPYCVSSPAALETLAEHGFSARRLDEGFPKWRRAGLPVETAAAD